MLIGHEPHWDALLNMWKRNSQPPLMPNSDVKTIEHDMPRAAHSECRAPFYSAGAYLISDNGMQSVSERWPMEGLDGRGPFRVQVETTCFSIPDWRYESCTSLEPIPGPARFVSDHCLLNYDFTGPSITWAARNATRASRTAKELEEYYTGLQAANAWRGYIATPPWATDCQAGDFANKSVHTWQASDLFVRSNRHTHEWWRMQCHTEGRTCLKYERKASQQAAMREVFGMVRRSGTSINPDEGLPPSELGRACTFLPPKNLCPRPNANKQYFAEMFITTDMPLVPFAALSDLGAEPVVSSVELKAANAIRADEEKSASAAPAWDTDDDEKENERPPASA